MSDLGASAEHERRKLEQVALAAAELQRAVEAEQRAREARDLAVRAAVRAGIPPGMVAKAAGITPARVSHLTIAPGRAPQAPAQRRKSSPRIP